MVVASIFSNTLNMVVMWKFFQGTPVAEYFMSVIV